MVTLETEAVSSCHTVNHPQHYIVSQPTTPLCKCTRILKLLQQNHIMYYDHRREKLNVLMDCSRKGLILCVPCMPIFTNATPIKTLSGTAHKVQVRQNRCVIFQTKCRISEVTETRERSTCVHTSRIAKCTI